MRLRMPAALVMIVVSIAAPAAAQIETATVLGTVTDAQGGVLPGATVTARNIDTGVARTGVTDADGRYRIGAIPSGRYEFTSELTGFSTFVRKGVTLTVGSESVINFQMALGGVAEAVNVIAETPVVETTTAAVQGQMNRQQIDVLPLIGRDYTSLLRLVPGAQNSNGVSFTGSRGRSNQWQIDGVDNSEDISGFSRQTPALESIKEVQVLVNGFKAEYGSASGGVVNVITRSGTNNVDGSAFYLFRNESMMAMNPYADRALGKDPFQRIHYGATIGGPLRRDRMHYFATYERQDRDTFSSSTRVMPTAAQISSAAPSTRAFLAQHGITPDLFGEGGRQRHVRPEFIDVHAATARLDTQVTANQSLAFRYTMDHDTRPSGESGTLFDFNGATSFFRTNYLNANHKWMMSSDKLNELYVQFGQSYGDWWVAYPALPNITITGGPSIGGSSTFPQGRTDYVTQVVNNFTWHAPGTRTGEHVFKVGVQAKIFKSDSFFDSNFRGTFTFPSIAAFLEGRPSRFTQNQGDSTLARPNEIYGVYLQDDWRPVPSLTLNLGLRYDYEGAKTEALRDVSGAPGPGISGDRNNVAPRFGFAWAPGNSTKHAIYGGTGIYHDQIILNIVGNARFTPPKVIGAQIENPAWPDPTAGGAITLPPPSVSIIDPNLVTPRNWNSQVGYRRELLPDLGLDVSFVYNRGSNHVAILNTNAFPRGSASVLGTPRTGLVRPDPNFTTKSFYSNYGDIRYKGLLVDLKKRFSRRLQAQVNYTLSKTMDNAYNFVSGFTVPERMDLSWGPGALDRRHVVASNAVIELPFDVQLGLVAEFQSEMPLNIISTGRDLNGDSVTGEWVHEDLCVTVSCPGFRYSRNSVRELSTEEANRLRALFGLTPIERFENNPKYFNLDATLQKRFRIGNQGIRLTLEAFNVLNTPQRELAGMSTTSGIDAGITSGTFGSYDDVQQPRAVQITFQFDW